MMPSYQYPYPNINNLQKRSSIASERPSVHNRYTTSINNSGHYDQNSLSPSTKQKGLNFHRNNAYFSPTQNLFNHGYNDVPNTEVEDESSEFTSTYVSNYPLYGLDWTFSNNSGSTAKIAVSSYREDSTNKLEIIYGTSDGGNHFNDYNASPTCSHPYNAKISHNEIENWNFSKKFEHSLKYPITRLQWDPSMFLNDNNSNEILATTSECLRIYQIVDNDNDIQNSNNIRNQQYLPEKKLTEKAALTNSKITNLNQLPPMTSFDWNRYDPSNLITCSIDTTCTVWNLVKETFVAKTQLIAHDSEVFDVKYICGGTNVFTSCSSDGSVRLFDLRNLEQSTIIYDSSELKSSNTSSVHNQSMAFSDSMNSTILSPGLTDSPSSISASSPKRSCSMVPTQTSKAITPLTRLATSNYNANQIAVLEANSNNILILDLRNISLPIYSLQSHSGTVNSISWHPNKNILLSGSDDSQVLLHDFSSSTTTDATNELLIDKTLTDKSPDFAFNSVMEVNNVCWSPDGSWVGINSGKQMQACKAL